MPIGAFRKAAGLDDEEAQTLVAPMLRLKPDDMEVAAILALSTFNFDGAIRNSALTLSPFQM